MSQNLISVSPPQANSPIEIDKSLKLDLNKPDVKQFKKDFEKELRGQKETSGFKAKTTLKDQKDRSEEAQRKKETDEKETTPGGNKKRVQKKIEDPTISNVMASVESAIEIPELDTTQTGSEDLSVSASTEQKTSVDQMLQQLLQKSEPSLDVQGLAEGQLADAQMVDAQAMQQLSDDLQGLDLAQIQQQLKDQQQVATDQQAVSDQQMADADSLATWTVRQEMGDAKAESAANLTTELSENREMTAFEKQVLESLHRDAGPAKTEMPSAQAGTSFGESSMEDSSQESLGDSQGSTFTGASFGTHGAHTAEKSFSQQMTTANAATGVEASPDEQAAKVQEIMNKAQYLVKQGGGEMTVNLNQDADGGAMQMKVLVENGQVSVEVKTNDLSLKKLVEEHLTDLRSGLAHHDLKVDAVKIDVVQSTSTDNNTQFQSNLNQGQFENRQSEAWSQFQDRLNQRRATSAKPFVTRNELRSVDNASMSSTRSTEGRTFGGLKGRQFNTVA